MAQLQIHIRRAESPDAAAVAEVYIASRRAAAEVIRTVHSDDEIRAWVVAYLVPNLEVWVAEVDRTIVAMMALEDEMIDQLYVHPKWQNGGIGQRLLQLAKERRPRLIRLHTFQANLGARRFYERHGFKPIDFTDGANNEEHQPDVLYEWTSASK